MDLGADVEAASNRIRELISSLVAGIEECRAFVEGQSDIIHEFRAYSERMTESCEGMIKDVSAWGQTHASAHDQVELHFDSLNDGMANASEEIRGRVLEIENSCLSLASVLGDSKDVTHAIGGQLALGREQRGQCYQQIEEAIQRHEASINQHIEGLLDGISRCRNALSESYISGTAVLRAADATFRLTMSERFTDLHNNLVTSEKEHCEALCQVLAVNADGIKSTSQQFRDAAMELADVFRERSEGIISGLVEHARTRIHDEVNETIENAVRTAIEELSAELVENLAVTELGVATTTALTPILPELVAAKGALKLINEFI